MGTKKILAFIVIAVLASGCASPAIVQNMVYTPDSTSISVPENSPFRDNLRVTDVYGGNETNPMWTSQVSGEAFQAALDDSLSATGLSTKQNPEPRFEVFATLSELDQPLIGFDLTVNSKVRYEVVEAKTRETWFNRQILASYTATFSDAAIAIKRLRLANEGSIRENIKIFIQELLRTPQKQALK